LDGVLGLAEDLRSARHPANLLDASMSERIRSLLQRVAAQAHGGADAKDEELRRRLPTTSVASLEREIASEIAYSLGRAAEKLEAALSQATSTLAELEAASPTSESRPALIDRYHDERSVAERRLRDLLIQREALGFRRHAELHERYPIPPRWRSG
jgi:hypothetical protein